MSWFVVGGIAIGATAGAIVGSKKGGDDVWKDALIGGAIGGVGAGVGAAAFAPAAEAAVPAAIGAEGGAGILGAEAAAGGSGLALGGAGLETGGAMAGGAGIAGGATPAATMVAPEAGAGILGGGAAPAALPGGAGGFGSYGGASVGSTGGFAPGMQAPVQMIEAPAASSFGGGSFGGTGGATVGETGGAYDLGAASQSPLEKGFGSAMSWLSEPKNAMLAGTLGLGALSMFNNNNEDNFGNSNVTPAGYPLSPNFKPSRYQPTRRYADGGMADAGSQNSMYPQSQIPDRTQFSNPTQMPASMEVLRSDYDATINPYTGDETRFAKGGDTSKYQAMIDPRMNVREERAPRWVGESVANVNDPGISVDRDPDTKYQDALTAAQTRMGKAAARANVKLGAMQKPTPLGKINLGPVAGAEEERKATGGIASLGGYAHGGNARLLRGPGDGMSDDIPATIADKQPARLADGEFVVPADVVSGLGNGSTEAGAKKLHQMMDKVRVDRTGTKKQGKQIKAEKYVPGMASGGIASFADGGNVDYSQYYVYDATGNQVPMSTLLSATQAQTTPVSPTANTTTQGYNPDYYNPQYYQSQLDTANKAIAQQQSTVDWLQNRPSFDPVWYAKMNPDVVASPVYGNNLYQHYIDWGAAEGRTPFEGGAEGVPNGTAIKELSGPEIAKAQSTLAEQQAALAPIQQNIQRLQNTATAYTPYTIANRPSASDPQFYGNIYKTPEAAGQFIREGYDMNAGLGVWNNEYGGNAAPTARQNKIAQMSFDQQAAGQQSLENAQAAALKSRQVINQAVNTGKNQPPAEEKKRKGGILAAKIKGKK